ncbi:DinB superfamily protein [compost metagenome]
MAAATNEQLVSEFQSLIPYIQSLATLEEVDWETPIAAGKWTLKEMLCHITQWDKYFYEEAFAKVQAGQPVTARQQNFDEFNARAIEYAKSLTKQAAIGQFVLYRTKILDSIADVSSEQFVKVYPDGEGNPFSIREHLSDFIPHDKHHKRQMEQYLTTVKGGK